MARQPGFLKRGEPVRLQAFLARSGIASRRAAEEMITHGRIAVNGQTVTAMGLTVVPGADRVEVDGEEVKVAPTMWLALHKPKGYVTTRIDPYGRRTVYDLLPSQFHGLFHVGRLDRDSEGLLLLTNDGELANRFLHPSYGITKEYEVVATGKPTDAALRQLTEGVELDDGSMARAESARLMGPAGNGLSHLKLVLREGKKREVRRMLAALGHEVTRLVRRRFGPIDLGELPRGKYRIVQPEELSHVRTPPEKTRAADSHGAHDAEPARPRGKAAPGKGKADAPRPRAAAAEREERPRGRSAPDEGRRPARGGTGPGADSVGGEATPKRAGSRAGTRPAPHFDAADRGKKRRPGQEQRGRPAELNTPVKRPRDEGRSLNEWDDEPPARPASRPRPDRGYEEPGAGPRGGSRGGGARGGRAGGSRGGFGRDEHGGAARGGGSRGGAGARGGRSMARDDDFAREDRGPSRGGAGARGGRAGGARGGLEREERGPSRGVAGARGGRAGGVRDDPGRDDRPSRGGAGGRAGGSRGGFGRDEHAGGPRGGSGARGGRTGGFRGDLEREDRGAARGGAGVSGGRAGGVRGGTAWDDRGPERGGERRSGGSRGGFGRDERGGFGGRFGGEERGGGARGARPAAPRADDGDDDGLDGWSSAPQRRSGGARGGRPGGGGARSGPGRGGSRGGGRDGGADRPGGGARSGAGGRAGGARGGGGRPGGSRGGGRPGGGARGGGGRGGGGRSGGGRRG